MSKKKVYVVTAVDYGDTCDNHAKEVGQFNTLKEAEEFIRKDMDGYLESGAFTEIDEHEVGDNIASGCNWDIHEIEVNTTPPIYVVTIFTDLHNCGCENEDPRVFAKREDAIAWAKGYYNEIHSCYTFADADKTDDVWDSPPKEDGSWSFCSDRDDMVLCLIHECEVQ